MWTWTVTNLEKSQNGCKRFDKHQQCTGEVPLHFQFVLNTVGVMDGITDKNVKGQRLDEHLGCTRITVFRNIPI